MRIAIFSWESLYAIKIGGVGIHVFNLARSLQRLGNEVHIFTRQGSKLSLEDMINGVIIHRLPWNHGQDFFHEVKAFNNTLVYYYSEISYKIGNFDILHCHDWLTFDAGLRLKNEVRLIATFHTTELGRSGHWPQSALAREISALEQRMVDNAKSIITVSYTIRRELELLYHCPDWKTEVIYHGIDTQQANLPPEQSQTILRAQHIPENSKIILFVGSFSHNKGTDILLNSCSQITSEHPDTVIVFFGQGELEGRITGTSRDLPGKIILMNSGAPDLLRILYNQAYIVACPFRVDPFAAITLTAWAAGKPVISLDSGASAEIIYNDVNSIISSEKNYTADLLALLADSQKVKWLGNNARVTVETAFTWDEVAKNTEKTYRAKS